MSSLGGNPGCRIHSDCVAMETGSSAGECRSICVCTKAGAARKGVGVLLCNGGTALEPRRGMETEEKKGEEGMKRCRYKERNHVKQWHH